MAFNYVVLAHLVLLGVWAGVVAAEAVLELMPRRRPQLHTYTVRAHYWIDLLVELPVILGVTISGMVLLSMVWPPTTLPATTRRDHWAPHAPQKTLRAPAFSSQPASPISG